MNEYDIEILNGDDVQIKKNLIINFINYTSIYENLHNCLESSVIYLKNLAKYLKIEHGKFQLQDSLNENDRIACKDVRMRLFVIYKFQNILPLDISIKLERYAIFNRINTLCFKKGQKIFHKKK